MAGEAFACALKASIERMCAALVGGGFAVAVLFAVGFRSHRHRVQEFHRVLLLGEIMGSRSEAHTNLKVERRFYLAGTYICQQAILARRIDIYPEYTGTALTAILKQERLVVRRKFIVASKKNTNIVSG